MSNKCISEVIWVIWHIFIRRPFCSWPWIGLWWIQATRSLPSRTPHTNLCFSANSTFSVKMSLAPTACGLSCSCLWSPTVCFPYTSSIPHLYIFVPCLALWFNLRGLMQADPTYAHPTPPLRRANSEIGQQAPPCDGCCLEGAKPFPLCARNHTFNRPSFNPLWGKHSLCYVADEETKVQRNFIGLVKVQKEFMVGVNLKQGLGRGWFG